MKSEDKKRFLTRQRRTAAISPGVNDAGLRSAVVRADSRSAAQVRTGGGAALNMTMPQFGPPVPEEILIDVDTYGDGMAFRFTWR